MYLALSDSLRSVLQFPSTSGCIDTSVDEYMLKWARQDDKWVVFIPRKPTPVAMRSYTLASILSLSSLPVALHILGDNYDNGFLSPSVCKYI